MSSIRGDVKAAIEDSVRLNIVSVSQAEYLLLNRYGRSGEETCEVLLSTLNEMCDDGQARKMDDDLFGLRVDTPFGDFYPEEKDRILRNLLYNERGYAIGYETGPSYMFKEGITKFMPEITYVASEREDGKAAANGIHAAKACEKIGRQNLAALQMADVIEWYVTYLPESEETDKKLLSLMRRNLVSESEFERILLCCKEPVYKKGWQLLNAKRGEDAEVKLPEILQKLSQKKFARKRVYLQATNFLEDNGYDTRPGDIMFGVGEENRNTYVPIIARYGSFEIGIQIDYGAPKKSSVQKLLSYGSKACLLTVGASFPPQMISENVFLISNES